ncbi:MAG: hypothetical protein ACLUB2_05985 [Butyricicoccus pullicaecorum]
MAGILILNGSPRAPRSNSKRYAALFMNRCKVQCEYQNITRTNHAALCEKMNEVSDVLLVFPLYADGLPVTLLDFLKTLETCPPERKPVISMLINCGFFEYHQNDIAVRMVELFCRQNGYRFGSVLKIASGEAILDTPFCGLVKRKLGQLAAAIVQGKARVLHVSMPLTRGMFVRASTRYWVSYGKKNGVSREQMAVMEIEGA